MSADIIIITLVAVGVAIVSVLVTVVVSGLGQARRDRLEPALQEARGALIAALSGGQSYHDEALMALGKFSHRDVTRIMLELAPSVTGTSRSILVSLADDLGVIKLARSRLQSRRWHARLFSARVLTALGVEPEDLCALLSDRSAEVRSQAASWTVVAPSDTSITCLIKLLDDSDGLCRFAAQDALIRIGLPGAGILAATLDKAEGVPASRILRVVAAMGDERFSRRVLALTKDRSETTRALAAEVLARIGNPEAGATLVAMLDDPSSEVRLAAAAALAKLSYWSAAPKVELLLGDPSWDLRKQGSLTLLALGAPGLILLRATAPGDGPAAEIAAQALQLRRLLLEEAAA